MSEILVYPVVDIACIGYNLWVFVILLFNIIFFCATHKKQSTVVLFFMNTFSVSCAVCCMRIHQSGRITLNTLLDHRREYYNYYLPFFCTRLIFYTFGKKKIAVFYYTTKAAGNPIERYSSQFPAVCTISVLLLFFNELNIHIEQKNSTKKQYESTKIRIW